MFMVSFPLVKPIRYQMFSTLSRTTSRTAINVLTER